MFIVASIQIKQTFKDRLSLTYKFKQEIFHELIFSNLKSEISFRPRENDFIKQ